MNPKPFKNSGDQLIEVTLSVLQHESSPYGLLDWSFECCDCGRLQVLKTWQRPHASLSLAIPCPISPQWPTWNTIIIPYHSLKFQLPNRNRAQSKDSKPFFPNAVSAVNLVRNKGWWPSSSNVSLHKLECQVKADVNLEGEPYSKVHRYPCTDFMQGWKTMHSRALKEGQDALLHLQIQM